MMHICFIEIKPLSRDIASHQLFVNTQRSPTQKHIASMVDPSIAEAKNRVGTVYVIIVCTGIEVHCADGMESLLTDVH